MENDSWFWTRGYWKVYVVDSKLKQKIERWKVAKLHCRYFYRNGEKAWDFIIPSKLYNRVAELLGLPLHDKNENRAQAGNRLKGLISPYKFTGVKSTKS